MYTCYIDGDASENKTGGKMQVRGRTTTHQLCKNKVQGVHYTILARTSTCPFVSDLWLSAGMCRSFNLRRLGFADESTCERVRIPIRCTTKTQKPPFALPRTGDALGGVALRGSLRVRGNA